jgi:twitching motility protein PilI
LSLAALKHDPFALLVEIERRARAAVAARQGGELDEQAWVGVGFRLGSERFVAGRSDVREVLPVPNHLTRVPGAKPWLRGIANIRGQLLTIVDLKTFLGAGATPADRGARVLVAASRETPTGLIVDEVLGFRRFLADDFEERAPNTMIRCDAYLDGAYRRGGEVWPRFSFSRLLLDEHFLMAGEALRA